MQLFAAAHELRVGLLRARALRLLQVINVLDLRVGADAVVVPAEVRLPVREKDRLILRAAEGRQCEVPPLGEEQGSHEDARGDRDVAEPAAARDEPVARAAVGAAKTAQREGLGEGEAGRVVGAVVGGAVVGRGVAVGI